MVSVLCVFSQGEQGEPGQKGSKGDKGEGVSGKMEDSVSMVCCTEAVLDYLCLFRDHQALLDHKDQPVSWEFRCVSIFFLGHTSIRKGLFHALLNMSGVPGSRWTGGSSGSAGHVRPQGR